MIQSIIEEIRNIKRRINDNSQRISEYYDDRHAESLSKISDNEDALCETTETMDSGFSEIEDAICELTELISNMEVQE